MCPREGAGGGRAGAGEAGGGRSAFPSLWWPNGPGPGGYGGAGSPPVSRGDLGGIVPPEASTAAERYEAVRLFADRAAASKPGFAVGPDNVASTAHAMGIGTVAHGKSPMRKRYQ